MALNPLDLIIGLEWRLKLDPDCQPKQVDRIWECLMNFFPNCGSMDHSDALKKMAEMLEDDHFIQAKSYIDYMDRINARLENIKMRFSTTTTESQIASHGMQSQVASQNDTIVSDGAKRSASLSLALPSMTSLTQTSVPKNVVAGLKKKSEIAKKLFSSQEFQHHQLMKQNPPTQMSNDVGWRSAKRQSETAHEQDLFQKKKQQHQLMNPQLFSSSHGMHSQMHNQRQQLLSQNDTIVSEGTKRSASLSPALPSMTSTLTQTSVSKNVVAGLKKKSGIAKKQFSSQESQHHHQLMKQKLLQPTQMSNDVGRSSTNAQSETAHAQDLFQKQQLMKQNLLQRTQMSNVVGPSTNTQSEIAQAQDLLQQKTTQAQDLFDPPLFPSSVNSSNAQTGQNADDWQEEFYQKVHKYKSFYASLDSIMKDIHQKIFKECEEHLKPNDSVSNVPQSERQNLLDLLEKHMRILNVSNDNIVPDIRLSNYEKKLINLIESHWPREPVSAQQKIQQPGGHPLSAQPRQQQQQQQQEEERFTTNQMQPKKS